MKKILFIFAMVAFLASCSSERVNFNQLQDRSGMFYLANSDKPFSGDVVSYVGGSVEFEGKMVKGLREETWVYYYPNGQKKMAGKYREGVKDGAWTYWKDNGTQEGSELYKYGKLLSREGSVGQETKTDTISQPAPVKVEPAPAPAQSAAPAPKKVVRQQGPIAWERLHGGPVKFLDGVPYTGPVVKYQKNGEKELDGYFSNGKKTGKWNFYDKKGNLKNSKYY
jgi:antitoxin component YwqK of YwqJK toxin-antitoxin module